jgi:50S ribosomal protein L16 3-hydroxylase
MLYLPPAVAHHGVALEPGFTYSIGFLAPTRRELFLSWAAASADADARAAERWADPWLTPAARPGQLSAEAVDAAVALLESLPRTRADVAAWFGCHVTTPRGGHEPMPLAERPTWDWVAAQGADAGELCRHESSRFAFLPPAVHAPGSGTLFADGRSFATAGAAAAAVAAEVADLRAVPWAHLVSLVSGDAEARDLLQTLLELGLLFVPSEEEEEELEDGADERVEEVDLEEGSTHLQL